MKAISTLLLLLAVSLNAQTPTHSETLVATDTTDFTTPGTIVFYRSTGPCPASGLPSGATALNSTPLPFPGTATFVDTNVQAGSSYCYYAIATAAGGGGLDSNNFSDTIKFGTLTLTGTSK